MATFSIYHGVKLNCSGTQLAPFQRYSTEQEDEIAELRELSAKFKVCAEEVAVPSKPTEKAKPQVTKVEKTVDAADDITLVKGVGAALQKKLAEQGIETKSQLGTALSDEKRTDEMKELLGSKYESVVKQFQAAA